MAESDHKCSRCGVMPSPSGDNFHKDRARGSGFASYCIECTRIRNAQWGKNNHKKRRETASEWRRRNPSYRHQYLKSHSVLNGSIAAGKLSRGPCVICGTSKTEGHHPDYGKPLNVIWLCKKHHTELHQGKLELFR